MYGLLPPSSSLPFVEVALFEPQVPWVKLGHHLGAYIDAVHLAQPVSISNRGKTRICRQDLVLGASPPCLVTSD